MNGIVFKNILFFTCYFLVFPFVKVLSTKALKDFPASVLSCSCLILETGLENFELPGAARALKSSPGIGILLINVNHYHNKFVSGQPPEFPEGFEIEEGVYLDNQPYPCLLNHVKTVKVTGLLRRNHIWQVLKNETLLQQWLRREVNLIKFLLKSAMVLERMGIKITDNKYFQQLLQSENIKSQLMIPRAPQLILVG
ncbi:hypothetical protein H6P81_005664 [Aristolochia fimbriata]|uniref:Uncharacterized protein n=1 Tax=Aristolochia fimbriata TaxID=158543 RepID=A0AAV7EV34_ARIFI|nr:hypothetical protein H6P81_005664 [Aristolochia fimbriata]